MSAAHPSLFDRHPEVLDLAVALDQAGHTRKQIQSLIGDELGADLVPSLTQLGRLRLGAGGERKAIANGAQIQGKIVRYGRGLLVPEKARPAGTPAATKAGTDGLSNPPVSPFRKGGEEGDAPAATGPGQYKRDPLAGIDREIAGRRYKYKPLSVRLMGMADLPESVTALLTYDQVGDCQLGSVLSMSKMACLLRQIGKATPRYYLSGCNGSGEKTLNSMYYTCREQCPHWIPDEDYNATRKRLGAAVKAAGKGRDRKRGREKR